MICTFYTATKTRDYSVSLTLKKFADWPKGNAQVSPLCIRITGEVQLSSALEPMTDGVKSVRPSTTGAVVMTGFPFESNEIDMIATDPSARPSPNV